MRPLGCAAQPAKLPTQTRSHAFEALCILLRKPDQPRRFGAQRREQERAAPMRERVAGVEDGPGAKERSPDCHSGPAYLAVFLSLWYAAITPFCCS
jgi:hypothetical protein